MEVTEAGAPTLFKQVARFEKEILSSKETFNKYYNDANRVATLAGGKYANYRAACDSIGTYSHSMTINESTDSYGAISHAKEVTRWAFDNKPGKVSNIITVDNNYFFVVAVTGAHKEGIAPVNEVADQIKSQLYSEKYAEKRQGEIAEQIAGMNDLEAIAEKLGTSVSTQNARPSPRSWAPPCPRRTTSPSLRWPPAAWIRSSSVPSPPLRKARSAARSPVPSVSTCSR